MAGRRRRGGGRGWGVATGAAGVERGVGLGEAFGVWAKVAANSFGGPAGQIAVMHRVLVDERRWLSEARFLHALNFCMLLPGPEAQQLAVYSGWLLHGTVGGLIAGILFILPGAVAILTLSIVYALYGDLGPVSGLLFGLQAAVVAVVGEAVTRIGRRALRRPAQAVIATAAFAAIFFAQVPFPAVVAVAAVLGYAGGRRHARRTTTAAPARTAAAAPARTAAAAPARTAAADTGADRPSAVGGARNPTAGAPQALIGDDGAAISPQAARAARRAAAVALALWLAPVAALVLAASTASVFTQEALLFSQTAVVSFGGAYAALAYVAQQAVGAYGWLSPGEMLTGLGLAETTPGPLIMVVQFVGFMAAYRSPGPLSPLAAGVAGSAITTWVTFVPCFCFIFAGAPVIERLRGNRTLDAALSAVTAAVVGAVGNLAVWFTLHTAFDRVATVRRWGLRLLVPDPASVNPAAVAITALAALAIFRLKLSVPRTLALCAALGLIVALVTGAGA